MFMSEKRKLKIISDPGHGWLSVKLQDLVTLGIENKISSYSYMTLARAYLEEDCDLSIYTKAATSQGWQLNFIESQVDKTPIRSYSPYTSSKLKLALELNPETEFLMYHNGKWSLKCHVTHMESTKIYVKSEFGNNFLISKSQFLNYVKPMEDVELNKSGSFCLSPKL